MLSATAFGDSISFKGLKIEGQTKVTINDKTIGEAIIVKGKSFVPVREITEGFGGRVEKASGKGIALTTDQTNKIPTSSSDISNLDEAIKTQKEEIADIKHKIKITSEKVEQFSDLISSTNSENSRKRYQLNYEAFKKALDQLEADLVDQESKLAEMEKQLAILQG